MQRDVLGVLGLDVAADHGVEVAAKLAVIDHHHVLAVALCGPGVHVERADDHGPGLAERSGLGVQLLGADLGPRLVLVELHVGVALEQGEERRAAGICDDRLVAGVVAIGVLISAVVVIYLVLLGRR